MENQNLTRGKKRAEYQREYREKNKEKAAEYREKNREKAAAYQREYYQRKKEKKRKREEKYFEDQERLLAERKEEKKRKREEKKKLLKEKHEELREKREKEDEYVDKFINELVASVHSESTWVEAMNKWWEFLEKRDELEMRWNYGAKKIREKHFGPLTDPELTEKINLVELREEAAQMAIEAAKTEEQKQRIRDNLELWKKEYQKEKFRNESSDDDKPRWEDSDFEEDLLEHLHLQSIGYFDTDYSSSDSE